MYLFSISRRCNMAASKEPLTILEPKLIRLINKKTRKGELHSALSIIPDLMLCAGATSEMRVEALVGQAGLVKRKGNRFGCRTVAKSAEVLQFHSMDWINRNLKSLNHPTRVPSAMRAGPTRDIRLDIDPSRAPGGPRGDYGCRSVNGGGEIAQRRLAPGCGLGPYYSPRARCFRITYGEAPSNQ